MLLFIRSLKGIWRKANLVRSWKNMAKLLLLLLSFIILVAFGVANGAEKKEQIGVFELKKGDVSVKFTNWGATIVSLLVPDRHGKLGDVVLGYDSIQEYQNDTSYFGSIVGRVANRIGGAKFILDGVLYKLVANEGNNTLHGGTRGFSDVVWKVTKYKKGGSSPEIVFSYRSFDGEEGEETVPRICIITVEDIRIGFMNLLGFSILFAGFPGDLLVSVKYTLIENNQLKITMNAKALNKPTPVNLAQHTYWNLGGHNSGNIMSNLLQIFGSRITVVDHDLIPTGKLAPIKGTPYDFLKPRTVGSRIDRLPKGYDINYALDGGSGGGRLKKAAIVHDKKLGRTLELSTNAPGVQFYTGNFIKDVKGKGGFVYQAHAALCLETQGFPDAVNHHNFPSTIVTPQKPYNHIMLFKFSADK